MLETVLRKIAPLKELLKWLLKDRKEKPKEGEKEKNKNGYAEMPVGERGLRFPHFFSNFC